MRVTTSMIFNSGSLGIQARTSELFKLQNQMSTGRRIMTPEDDPIGAWEALQVSQSKGVNKQYLDNQSSAMSQLTALESTLGSVGDQMLAILEKAAEGGNPTFDATKRGMVAEEMKQRLNSLIDLANTKDSSGLYIFSGFKGTTQPFVANASVAPYSLTTGTYLTYQGDAGKETVQVSATESVAVSENGYDTFLRVKDGTGTLTGKSVFDGIKNMIDILDGTRPYSAATHATFLADINTSINHIATVRAAVGSRQNSVDSLSQSAGDSALLFESRLSELQDLDYTAAISQFSKIKLQLEAAQITFKQSSELSLFNIL